MSILKPINFLSFVQDIEVKKSISHGIFADWDYKQIAQYAAEDGYFLPEDQYKALKDLFNAQLDLDIGNRQTERA